MLEQLNAQDKDMKKYKAVLAMYKTVFLSDELGRKVLEDMLDDLCFLRPATTPEEQARNNYAKELLAKIYDNEIPTYRLFKLIRKLLKRRKGNVR